MLMAMRSKINLFIPLAALISVEAEPTGIWDLVRRKLCSPFWMNSPSEISKNYSPSTPSKYEWNITDIFRGPYSFAILNTPIVNPEFATSIWRKANFKMLIDGGGNEMYDLLFTKTHENISEDLPNVLCGDFDSIRADVFEFFKSQNVEIINTPDQNEPDSFKGLKILSKSTSDPNVIVYCDNVGRLDHIMQNLNLLFKVSSHETLNKYNIFLLGNKSLTWLLRPGSHTLHVPQYLWTSESYCALIPVGHPCHVTTEGLKWNLHDGELQFGKMVSSSNAYDIAKDEAKIQVTTTDALIWTMNIDDKISIL